MRCPFFYLLKSPEREGWRGVEREGGVGEELEESNFRSSYYKTISSLFEGINNAIPSIQIDKSLFSTGFVYLL